MNLPLVVKRDGKTVEFDSQRIQKAAQAAGLSEEESEYLLDAVIDKIRDDEFISVEDISDIVEDWLSRKHPTIGKKFILYREERRKFRTVPNPDAISDYIFFSKYAREAEDWTACVARNAKMHVTRHSHLAQPIATLFHEFVLPKKVLPSMRSLQFAGDAIFKHNARMYNCSFSHCNRIAFFGETFYLLLAGCGVGFSVFADNIAQLPKMRHPDRTVAVQKHMIGDSIEGWATAITALLLSYSSGYEDHYNNLEFDYQYVRPEGAEISSGGLAPGHTPLRRCIEDIRRYIEDEIIKGNNGIWKPIHAYDITCMIAVSVLSGGIRRSSLIALFDKDDVEMRNAKTGEWYKTHPYRAMSNNSAVYTRNEDRVGFDAVKAMREYGEPGFFITSSKAYGTNPCGEIGLHPPIDGFQFCNLTEINVATVEDEEDFFARCYAASAIGTLQACFTEFPFLSLSTKARCEEEALIGVSLTGIADVKGDWFTPENLQIGAARVLEANEEWSNLLGINPAARTTTVKPSGTASLLLGGIGSGIHAHHATRYIRRVTANRNEPAFLAFREANLSLVKEKPNGDFVIEFPMYTPGMTIKDSTPIEFMNLCEMVYNSWIVPGTRHYTVSPCLTHNVSCTVSVFPWEDGMLDDEAWFLVAQHLQNLSVQAMSFLPHDGDKKYPFAPREAIVSKAEFMYWRTLIEEYKSPDWGSSFAIDKGGACEGSSCEL